MSQASIWYQSSSHWWPPPISMNQKKTGKFPQLNHNSWSLLWMIPSHKEPEWLFWMSDDFKIFNCFYPPACSKHLRHFNVQSFCLLQYSKAHDNRDVTKISSLCRCKYNKTRQGIKQLGNSFWFYFFFHFLMKVGEGHIHSSCRGKSPAPTS